MRTTLVCTHFFCYNFITILIKEIPTMSSVYRQKASFLIPINVTGKPQEVRFGLVSCMCDNRYTMLFKKTPEGEYRISAGGSALSNFQMKGDYSNDLRWAATKGDWKTVASIIRTGTSAIEKVDFLPDYNEVSQVEEINPVAEVNKLQRKISQSIKNKLRNKRKPRDIASLDISVANEKLVAIKVKSGVIFLYDETDGTYREKDISLLELAKIDQIVA